MNNTKDAMYCRLCALLKRQNQLRELQSDDESCQMVVNQLSKFNIVLDLQATKLPKTVCLPCVKSLEKAFKFVTAVEEAQAFLCDFILVKIDTAVTHSCEENIFYEGEDDDKNETNHFRNEKCQDYMKVNDGGLSLNKDIDSGVIMTDMHNVNDKSVINGNTVEHTKMGSKGDINEQDVKPTNDVIKPNIDNKVECDENPFKNHVDNKKNVLNYILAKVNNNSGSTLLKNKVCSIDEVNKHNDSKVAIAANNIDKSKQQLQLKHKESKSKKKPLNQSNTTVHSKTNKIKIQKLKENDKKDNKVAAKNIYTDIDHIKMTWKEYEWQCSRCETLFLNVDDLQEHSMQVHKSCNLYKCIDCGMKRSNLKCFLVHVRTHRTDLNHSCYVCFEKFLSISKVGSHRRWEHENSKYLCLGCRIPFDNNVELKEHVDKYYNKNKIRTPSDLTCRLCNMICANGKEWRRHGLTHQSKEFVCETCGKSFLTKQRLKAHVLVFHVKKLFKCDICNTAVKSAYSLREHATIHSGIKPFTCDNCGKSFRTKKGITRHMKIHSKYSLHYTCTVCNKKFGTKSNLGCHMRQHTGAQPFSCDICLRDFTNLSNRNKHMRRRHGIEMVKRRQLKADIPTSDLATEEAKFTEHK